MYQKGRISPKIQMRRFWGNQRFWAYEMFLRPPTISTTLQGVGFFPTLVYFYLWAMKGLFGLFVVGFMAVKGLFVTGSMTVKRLFKLCLAGFIAVFMVCLWLVLWVDL